MIKSVVDGTIAEHQANGPVFLPEGGLPPYRELVTGTQHLLRVAVAPMARFALGRPVHAIAAEATVKALPFEQTPTWAHMA